MRIVLPAVKVTGDFFVNTDGSEFHYVGLSDFALWKRFNMDNGPEALVRPLLIERRHLAVQAGYTGPIVLRVFRYSHPGNVFGALPGTTDYGKIGAFLDMCAEYNMYVDMTCGDSNQVLPSVTDQQADLDNYVHHLEQAGQFSFVETCNEPFKNGDLPRNGVKPPPSVKYLRDSGNYQFISSTQRWETEYDLDFISGHFDRTNDAPRWPRWVCDIDDSISTLRRVVGLPPVMKETAMFGRDYTDPAAAHELGLRISMGGVLLHSLLGLQSNGFDTAHMGGAYAYFKGVVGALA